MHRYLPVRTVSPILRIGLLASFEKATPALTSCYRNCWLQIRLASVSVQPKTAVTPASSQLSYAYGACNQTFLSQTIGDNLTRTASKMPNNLAISSVHQQVRW